MSTDSAAVRRPIVLLVEDDPLSLKLMRDVLQANGFDTVEVLNGSEAVSRAAEVGPAAIVMDIGLPGMDGVKATALLKGGPATRAIPVVAVTAYAMSGDEQRMRDAGCDAFLSKPLRFAEFVAVIRELVTAEDLEI